jgi:hypothetical protein
MKAADFLPPSSQAFAAVLCRATGWLIDREPERAALVYARYLREGSYVRWARTFGRRCPQPDFRAASRRVWAVRVDSVTRFARTHPMVSAGLGVAILGLAILTARLFARRRVKAAGRAMVPDAPSSDPATPLGGAPADPDRRSVN